MPKKVPEYLYTLQSVFTLLMIEDKQRASEFGLLSEVVLPNLRLAHVNNHYDLEILEDALLEGEQAYYEYLHGWNEIKDINKQIAIKKHFDKEESIYNENKDINKVVHSTVLKLMQSELDFNSDEYKNNQEKMKKHLLAISLLFEFDIIGFNKALTHVKTSLKAIT